MFGNPGDRPGRTFSPEAVSPSLIKARVWLSAAAITSNGAGYKIVPLDSVHYDSHGIFDKANNRLRPSKSGHYWVTGHYRLTQVQSAVCCIYKNGSVIAEGTNLSGLTNGHFATSLVYMNGETDYLQLVCYDASGGVAYNNDITNTWLSIVGPL